MSFRTLKQTESTSCLHRVSSSMYSSTRYPTMIFDTFNYSFLTSSTSDTSIYVYFEPLEQIFNWYHFLGLRVKDLMYMECHSD